MFGTHHYKINSKMWLISVIFLFTFVSSIQSLAVMSVDLGTEYMKVAVVSVSTRANCFCPAKLTFLRRFALFLTSEAS